MSNLQRTLLAVYLPLTILVFFFDHRYPGQDVVLYLKYAVMMTLFFSVISIRKKYPEQRLMSVSYFFLIIADFFLVFSGTLEPAPTDFAVFGIAGFLCAYLCLIAAFQKNFAVKRKDAAAAVPIAAVFLAVFFSLRQYVGGILLLGTIAFGITLCYMTWTAVCTLFRGYYTPKAAALIALSGCLMFICDMAVAFSLFHPSYSGIPTPWLEHIIWTSYIPGWTLLAVVISEENLRMA